MFALLVLVACKDKEVPLPVAEPAPLSPPHLAIAAATAPGVFRSTCVIQLDLLDAATDELVDTVLLDGVDGGQWGAIEIPEATLFKGSASWSDCLNNDSGTGTEEISSFSSHEGILSIFRYSGVATSFETLTQREDFVGGTAVVEFDAGTDSAGIEAAAESLGVTGAAEGDTWTFTWEDETAVAAVLSTMSAVEGYSRGAPVWEGDPPDWW